MPLLWCSRARNRPLDGIILGRHCLVLSLLRIAGGAKWFWELSDESREWRIPDASFAYSRVKCEYLLSVPTSVKSSESEKRMRTRGSIQMWFVTGVSVYIVLSISISLHLGTNIPAEVKDKTSFTSWGFGSAFTHLTPLTLLISKCVSLLHTKEN